MGRRVVELGSDGYFHLTSRFDRLLHNQILADLPKAHYNGKTWEVPSRHAQKVEAFAQKHGFTITPDAEQKIRLFSDYYQGNRVASKSMASSFSVDSLPLLPYQKAGVELMVRQRRSLLGDDAGLGKSLQALAAIKVLDAFPLVIICPAIVKYKWQKREVKRWLGLDAQVVEGSKPVEGQLVTIVNPDILSRHFSELKALNPKSVIVDESHMFKGGETVRTGLVMDLVQTVDIRFLLTATPVINRPRELMSQLEILDRLEAFGGKKYFISRYCDGYSSGANNEYELHQRLREVCYIRRDKREVLKELPPLTHEIVPIEIDEKAQYFDATGRLDNPLTRITLARQTALRGKIRASVEYIKSIAEHERVIIFAHHVEAVETLAAQLGSPYIHGSVPTQRRDKIISDFQEGKYKTLVMNLISGGVGIDLYKAHHVVFVELPWTPALLDQAIARCWRLGQEYPVTAHYLIASGTVEAEIAHLIDQKRGVVEPITEGTDNGHKLFGRRSLLNFLLRQRESDEAMSELEKRKEDEV